MRDLVSAPPTTTAINTAATAFRLRALGMAALAFSLLAGCAGTHPPPQVDSERIKQVSGRGYLSDDRFDIATMSANWGIGEYDFDITWTLPVSGRNLPLVVYLPGLGEASSAGEAWRKAWARAGYAVLAVQPLAEDREAWSSNAARRGDFGIIAKGRYAATAVTARMQALAALLTELRKRAGAGDGQASRLDTTRVALAGFDIGAYTSMLAGGELPPGDAAPIRQPLPIAAVIALSPYADFSGHPFTERYRSISGPVLSVSGDEDADAVGAVTSPSVRKAPFETMPSRDAYLLWLVNATHTTMSGSAGMAGEASAEGNDAAAQADEGRASRKGGSHRGRRDVGSGGGGGDNARRADTGGMGNATESPTARAISATLIEGVTTAFLDAYMKQDPVAREWLHKGAVRWLADRGELRWK
jgi:predicted dienelactone hydrolase